MHKFVAQQLAKPNGLGGKIIFRVMNKQNRLLYQQAALQIAAKDGEKILDIGCGNGNMLNLLAQTVRGDFYGIDISQSILRSAQAKNRKFAKNSHLTFAVGAVNKIPFESEIFDKIYTINTVYFWQNLTDAMA